MSAPDLTLSIDKWLSYWMSGLQPTGAGVIKGIIKIEAAVLAPYNDIEIWLISFIAAYLLIHNMAAILDLAGDLTGFIKFLLPAVGLL